MDMKIVVDSGRATVFLEGRLAFGSYPGFRDATSPLLDRPDVKEIHIDLAGVDYLDSSALGMLLLLGQRTRSAEKELALEHPAPKIATVLKDSNFGQLIPIIP